MNCLEGCYWGKSSRAATSPVMSTVTLRLIRFSRNAIYRYGILAGRFDRNLGTLLSCPEMLGILWGY